MQAYELPPDPNSMFNRKRGHLSDEQALRWWLESKENAYRAVWPIADRIHNNMRRRQRQNYVFAQMYNDVDIEAAHAAGEYAGLVSNDIGAGRIVLNVVQNAIDTAASMIAKNRPKPMFLPDGGDFELGLRAQLLTRYVAGVFDDAKIDEIAERVFTDACVYGTGAIKFWADPDEGRVRAEHVFIGELLVDDLEGWREKPRQLHQRKYVSRDELAAQFPKFKAEIEEAAGAKTKAGTNSVSDEILVIESWHLPSGPDAKDGLHTICIENATLHHKEYKADYYPILFWRWYPSTCGFWGRGICHQIGRIQREINRNLRMITECMALMAAPVWWVEKGSGVSDGVFTNEIGRVGTYVGTKPDAAAYPAVHEQVYQHPWTLEARAYNIVGINQQMAQGQKPKGVESGAALREATDIASGRFQVVAQRWEAFYIEMARVVVDLSRELDKAMKGELATLAAASDEEDALERIDWSDVDMERDRYKIRVFPVSGLSQSPAGRIQQVIELVAQNMIPREWAFELLNMPDLNKFRKLETATLRRVRSVVAQIKREKAYGVELRPLPQMQLEFAAKIVQFECVDAQNQGVDEPVIELLQAYLDDIYFEIQQQAPQQQPAPPAGGAPPPQGPPASPFQQLAA